jgi:predicted GIY-YIG superfamily endonuclease
MTKKIPKRTEQVYKVYVTHYTDGSFYIGFTSKSGKALESYFGSNTIKDKLVDHKKIVFTSKSKATAKLFELLLQLSMMDTPECVNDMLNVRVRVSHMRDLPKFRLEFNNDEFNLKKD